MEIIHKTKVFYRESTDEWVIENHINVQDVVDFTSRIALKYKPYTEEILQEKQKAMQEVYIGYMLKGE